MNRRKLQPRLNPNQCRQLHSAWLSASLDLKRPLDTMISIRPASNPAADSLEYAILVEAYYRWLGQLSRRHVSGPFTAVLVRETLDRDKNYCTNFHVLMHTGNQLEAIRRAHLRRFSGADEVDVKRATQTEWIDRCGKVRSALLYITKERDPRAAFNVAQNRHDKLYRDGLHVLGKRYRMTANLRASFGLRVVTRNPLVTPAKRRENRQATALSTARRG